jgi:hypothetical protein
VELPVSDAVDELVASQQPMANTAELMDGGGAESLPVAGKSEEPLTHYVLRLIILSCTLGLKLGRGLTLPLVLLG